MAIIKHIQPHILKDIPDKKILKSTLTVERAIFQALSNCIIKKVRKLTFFLVRVRFAYLYKLILTTKVW